MFSIQDFLRIMNFTVYSFIFFFSQYELLVEFKTFQVYLAIKPSLIANRVIILGIDGAGDLFNAKAPNIRNFMKKGIFTTNGKAVLPSMSAECWGSMFFGVDPRVHHLTNDRVTSPRFPVANITSNLTSIFSIVRKNYPKSEIAMFFNWEAFGINIVPLKGLGITLRQQKTDSLIVDKTLEYLSTNDPKLFFLQLDEVDHIGHLSIYGSETHLKAIDTADEQIGRILELIDKRGWSNDSLIMVVTDHGGGGDGINPQGSKQHGTNGKLDMTVFFAATGPNIPINREIFNFSIIDIPAIASKSLGISKPLSWTSKDLDILLDSPKTIIA